MTKIMISSFNLKRGIKPGIPGTFYSFSGLKSLLSPIAFQNFPLNIIIFKLLDMYDLQEFLICDCNQNARLRYLHLGQQQKLIHWFYYMRQQSGENHSKEMNITGK